MKTRFFPIHYKKKVYRLHNLLGFLLEYEYYEKGEVYFRDNSDILFQQVLDPYLLISTSENNRKESLLKVPFYTKIIAQIFTFLCLRSFLFVRLLSHFRLDLFNSSEQAILFYRKLYPKEQPNLCLPRSLFAACTSKSFKNKGALFIGVFLPSRAMHAWIIEDGKHPDLFDDIWICYQPLAIMYKS